MQRPPARKVGGSGHGCRHVERRIVVPGVAVTPRAYRADMSTVDPLIVRIAERRLHLVTDDETTTAWPPSPKHPALDPAQAAAPIAPGVLSTSAGPYGVSQRELALCLSLPCRGALACQRGSDSGASGGCRRIASTSPCRRARGCHDHRAIVHYSTRLPDHHVVDLIDGARVTSVARTVFDLGGVLPESAHLSVIEDVRNKRLCTDAEIGEVYDDLCGRGRRGSAAWMRLVASRRARARARRCRSSSSSCSRRLVDAGPAAGRSSSTRSCLPNGRTVHLDLAYLSQRVDIEVDHNEWHATPTAVAQDKQRDLGLAMLGWERLRFTGSGREAQPPRLRRHRSAPCSTSVRRRRLPRPRLRRDAWRIRQLFAVARPPCGRHRETLAESARLRGRCTAVERASAAL